MRRPPLVRHLFLHPGPPRKPDPRLPCGPTPVTAPHSRVESWSLVPPASPPPPHNSPCNRMHVRPQTPVLALCPRAATPVRMATPHAIAPLRARVDPLLVVLVLGNGSLARRSPRRPANRARRPEGGPPQGGLRYYYRCYVETWPNPPPHIGPWTLPEPRLGSAVVYGYQTLHSTHTRVCALINPHY